MNAQKFSLSLLVITILMIAFLSCKSQMERDGEAQSKIEASLPSGATVEVNDGIAIIDGMFPDEGSRTEAEMTAKKVAGVKSVINNSSVIPEAPPIDISADEELSGSLNEILKDYPNVQAQVNGGVITLSGTISQSELQQLMQTVNTLHPGRVENQLTVQ